MWKKGETTTTCRPSAAIGSPATTGRDRRPGCGGSASRPSGDRSCRSNRGGRRHPRADRWRLGGSGPSSASSAAKRCRAGGLAEDEDLLDPRPGRPPPAPWPSRSGTVRTKRARIGELVGHLVGGVERVERRRRCRRARRRRRRRGRTPARSGSAWRRRRPCGSRAAPSPRPRAARRRRAARRSASGRSGRRSAPACPPAARRAAGRRGQRHVRDRDIGVGAAEDHGAPPSLLVGGVRRSRLGSSASNLPPWCARAACRASVDRPIFGARGSEQLST